MKIDKFSLEDKAAAGAILGFAAGGIGATVGTIWGGYEIGSAINDAINLSNGFARGLVDVMMMGIVAGPCYSIGLIGGPVVGASVGGIFHGIGSAISGGYHKVTGIFHR